MDGTITNTRIIRRLDYVADVIEGLYLERGTPVIVSPTHGIRVMGNWARIRAEIVTSSDQAAVVSSHLRRHNISADRATVSPCHEHFGDVKKKVLSDAALDTLSWKLKLTEHSQFRASASQGKIIFDFPLSELMGEEAFVPLEVYELPEPRPNAIPLGATMDGEIVYWMPEDARHCHVLIAGVTGSGKTTLCNTVIAGLVRAYTPDKLQMFLTSGKQEDVALWEGLPHLLSEPTYSPQTSFAILRWLEQERRRRSEIADKSFPYIVLYIGECSVLVELNPKQFTDALESIMKLGRSEKIIVVAATQRPKGDQVGNVIARAQFPLSYCGKVHNPTDSYISLGRGAIGAEFLPGNGAFVSNDGTRFQAAFFADAERQDEARRLVGALRRGPWKINRAELDDNSTSDTGVLTESDILDTMEWLASAEKDTTSISEFQTVMGWGYSRAARVFRHLQAEKVLGTERDNMKRVEVFREKLGSEGE